jgi:hypothetical protein
MFGVANIRRKKSRSRRESKRFKIPFSGHYNSIKIYTITVVLERIQNVVGNFHIVRVLTANISMFQIPRNNINWCSVHISSITYTELCWFFPYDLKNKNMKKMNFSFTRWSGTMRFWESVCSNTCVKCPICSPAWPGLLGVLSLASKQKL